MSAEKLIRQTARGDKAAFERLYTDFKGLVFAVALSVLRSREDAEDVTAETFIRVYGRAKDFSGGSGKSWIAAIARNMSLDKVRKRKHERLFDEGEAERLPCDGFEGAAVDRTVIQAAMTVLGDDERETVLLYSTGYKLREIAEIRGEKLGTVSWRNAEALKKMRKYIEGGARK